jgi:NDP-sugar pyrophosphorylase family protein
VILAGGFGTRLQTAVPNRQKVVAPVGGRPFLYRVLDQLADAGVRKVVLCTGFRAVQVAEAFGELYRGMRLYYSAEATPLGTAGALRQALPMLDTDPVLVLNGDSYCAADLPVMMVAHHGSATIVVREVDDAAQSGRVDFDATGAVTNFVEKGASGRGWINAGIYCLGREILESIPGDRAVSLEREIFPVWAGRGLQVFRTEEKFIDIGTPDAYVAAQRFFS